MRHTRSWVTANDPRTTNLRMGVEMPLQAGTSINYRNVGTSIDCNAVVGPGGTYKLALTVSDSSVTFAERDKPLSPEGQPSFRSFHSTFNILLRDGQSAQYTDGNRSCERRSHEDRHRSECAEVNPAGVQARSGGYCFGYFEVWIHAGSLP